MKLERKSTYPFLESVGVYDGQAPLLPYHQARVDRTFAAFYPEQKPLDLKTLWEKTDFPSGHIKWRIPYNARESDPKITPFPTRNIEQLQIVVDDTVEYAYKFTERDRLDALYEQKANVADEILIIRKGLLTDAYYYNVVVIMGPDLLTPRQPLLPGVMRAFCLKQEKIQCADIRVADLTAAEGVYLINALHPLERAAFIERERIFLPSGH